MVALPPAVWLLLAGVAIAALLWLVDAVVGWRYRRGLRARCADLPPTTASPEAVWRHQAERQRP